MPENSDPSLIRWRSDVDWRVKNMEDRHGELANQMTIINAEVKNNTRNCDDKIGKLQERMDREERVRGERERSALLWGLSKMAGVIVTLLFFIWSFRDAFL